MGVASRSVVASVSDEATDWLLDVIAMFPIFAFLRPDAGGRRDSPWWGNRVIAALIVGTARMPTSFPSDRGFGTYSTRSVLGLPLPTAILLLSLLTRAVGSFSFPFLVFRGGGGSIKEDELPLSPSSIGISLSAFLLPSLLSSRIPCRG